MTQQETRVDTTILRIKNNPLTAAAIVLGTIIIALAAFTDAVNGIMSLMEGKSPEAARAELAKLSLEYTPDVFIESVRKSDTHALRLFLTAGMDVNTNDGEGRTALMYAARAGDIPTINILLDRKADVNERNSGGATALSWAVAGEHEDVLRLLLDHGADAEAINEAFVSAAESGRLGLVIILLRRGANVKMVGSTALLSAAGSSVAGVTDKELGDVVRFLIDSGIDPNAKDEDGWTALLYATSRDYASVVEILLASGADVDTKCECRGFLGGGWTALMIAIHQRETEIVEALLRKGADVSIENHLGQTALLLAMEQGDERLVQTLRDQGAVGIVGAVSNEKVDAMLVKHGLYDKIRNPSGEGMMHEYEAQAIGDAVVVLDHATGLMWQKGGSERMSLDDAGKYVNRLNDERFAGFSDWRLPTLEEAMSLMEPHADDALHIAPVFQSTVSTMWTADRSPVGRGWMLYLYDGILTAERPDFNSRVRAVRSTGSVAHE